VISSLFSGNAVVVKPSEHSTWSSMWFAGIIRRVLKHHGHDPNLVQIVSGEADVGQTLVSEGLVDKIFFTGSTAVGKKVALAAAATLTPVVLELGGKDPFVICDDADFSQACQLVMRGVFQNAGQNCIGVERVFVQDSIHQKFTDRIVPEVKALRQRINVDGWEVDVGAMTMGEPALKHIQRLVDDAVAKGAKLLCGGSRNTDVTHGAFYRPTVLDNVTSDMLVAQEEVFGPVMSIFSFKDDDDLVALANACPFALGSSVFSLNTRRARALTKRIDAGMANINDFGVNYLAQSLPFGGMKQSGYDKFAGVEGLRGCCMVKAVTEDRFPGVRTTIPPPMQYPMKKNAFAFVQELICLFYEPGWLHMADNVRNMMVMLVFRSWSPGVVSSGWH